jgi:hypothetical protein
VVVMCLGSLDAMTGARTPLYKKWLVKISRWSVHFNVTHGWIFFGYNLSS